MFCRNQRGFTLLELLIVVAIIGILAAIAIPGFNSYRLKSYNSAASVDLRAMRTMILAFSAEEGHYPYTP